MSSISKKNISFARTHVSKKFEQYKDLIVELANDAAELTPDGNECVVIKLEDLYLADFWRIIDSVDAILHNKGLCLLCNIKSQTENKRIDENYSPTNLTTFDFDFDLSTIDL